MENPNAPIIKAEPPLLIPQAGERALIVGQTGGGKTRFATWLLRRVEQSPIVIYDTKEEPHFLTLPYVSIATSLKEVTEQIRKSESDYIIFRPPLSITADPTMLDNLLLYHYHNFKGVPAYIDEIYSFHNSARAGAGLIGLLTRGRSRGITTIMSTQRPAWLSMFAISEAQKLYIFNLSLNDDKKKIAGAGISNFENLPRPPKFGFWFFVQGTDKPVLYSPVKLERGDKGGYTDDTASDASDAAKSAIWI
jgi:DNA helicase HerA-like ATPase